MPLSAHEVIPQYESYFLTTFETLPEVCSAAPVQRKRSSSRSAAQHPEFVVIRAICLDPTVYRWNASEAVQPSLAKSACATNQRTRSPGILTKGRNLPGTE